MRDPLTRRAVLIDIALGFALGSVLVGLLSGLATGLVVFPIEFHGAGSTTSLADLTVVVAGLAFSFYAVVEYTLVFILLALITIFVARRLGNVLWEDEP